MINEELSKISPLLSDRTRLAIMATLGASAEPIEFGALVDALNVTKGNLSSHMRKLEEHHLVRIRKEFVERKPRTTYALTADGEKALRDYLKAVEALLTTSIKGGKE